MTISTIVGGDTLVLNSDGLPLNLLPVHTVNWRDAIGAVYQNKVAVLHNYEDWIVRSPSVSFQVPSVIMLRKWSKLGRKVKFSRRNVYLRDRYHCQFCKEQFDHQALTMDHVIPRVKGGKTTFDNIVSACGPCNHEKSHYDYMRPDRPPRKPTYGEISAIIKDGPIIVQHHSWNNYLGWPENKVFVNPKARN